MGLAHIRCRVLAAEARSDKYDDWAVCSVCKQAFTGEMRRHLSSALSERDALDDGEAPRTKIIQAKALEVTVLVADGRYKEAELEARGYYEKVRALYGEEHSNALEAARLISSTLARQRKYDEAERIQRAVLEVSKRVFGSEHELTIQTMGNLANTLSNLGSHADARRLIKDAVEVSTRVNGADHPETLMLMIDSNMNLERMGIDCRVANLPLFRKIFALNARRLGAEHPTTIKSKSELAALLRALGKLEEALQLQREVHPLSTLMLGAEHPTTIWSKSELAKTLCALDRLEEAIPLQREVVADNMCLFGNEGPDTLEGLTNLAGMLDRDGAYAEAEGILRGLHAHYLSELGEEHPETQSALRELTTTVWNAGCGGALGKPAVVEKAVAQQARGRREEAIGMQRRLVALAKIIGHEGARQDEERLMDMVRIHSETSAAGLAAHRRTDARRPRRQPPRTQGPTSPESMARAEEKARAAEAELMAMLHEPPAKGEKDEKKRTEKGRRKR
jgi:tetratricopeptide (TPR) repeat protein